MCVHCDMLVCYHNPELNLHGVCVSTSCSHILCCFDILMCISLRSYSTWPECMHCIAIAVLNLLPLAWTEIK
jgi:hypothetical protein